MNLRFTSLAAMGIVCVLLFPAKRCPADTPERKSIVSAASPQQGRQAVERSLAFLEKDARKWRKEHDCSTCHHGAMTVWALDEAKGRGYPVNSESLEEITGWTKARFVPPPNQPPDLRPGYNIPSMAAVYLNLARRTNKESVSPEEADRIVKHITDRQEADGAWPTLPPANARPPVFESRETMALWYYLALEPVVVADLKEPPDAQTSRDRAEAWLKKIGPVGDTQTTALRLLVQARAGQSGGKLHPAAIAALLKHQNSDGGWSQLKALPSDAYATGLALYALSEAGVRNDRKEVQRAVAFLVAAQKEDGSWPMSSRETPEVKAAKNLEPIIHIGSAWATIGMVRSLPKE